MAGRAIRVGLLLPALAGAGCGTVANLCDQTATGHAPFGGVHLDREYIRQEIDREPVMAALTAADLPFSLAGDVVTLPYVRAYRYINEPVGYPSSLLLAGPPIAIAAAPTTAPQTLSPAVPPATPAVPTPPDTPPPANR